MVPMMMMFVKNNVQNGTKITISSSWKNGVKLVITLSTQQTVICSFLLCVCVCFPQICHSVDESQWVTSDIVWVSCCFFLWSPQVLLIIRESENVTFFFLWVLHLQCFSFRIIVYAVFPRSMSLRQEIEWPSLSEKKSKIVTILNAQELALNSS